MLPWVQKFFFSSDYKSSWILIITIRGGIFLPWVQKFSFFSDCKFLIIIIIIVTKTGGIFLPWVQKFFLFRLQIFMDIKGAFQEVLV